MKALGCAAATAALTALTACGPPAAEVTIGTAPSASTPGSHIRVVQKEQADLYLWVSNQSFDDDPVKVTVHIDGTEVVAESFEVGSQHNWVLFPVEAPPGDHLLRVTSGTGVHLDEEFTLPEKGLRYAAIDYWFYPDDKEGRHFSWRIQSEPMAFD